MRVLLAVDQSEYAEIVLEHGLDQAARLQVDELHFATAVHAESEVAAARSWLEAAVGDLIETFRCTPKRVMLHVRRGRPAAVVATLVEELRPDLLVIGRFHVPSESEAIAELVHCPTLVVGIDGHVLDPQCLECGLARRDSDGEVLFCEIHSGDRFPDLAMRLPPSYQLGSRLW